MNCAGCYHYVPPAGDAWLTPRLRALCTATSLVPRDRARLPKHGDFQPLWTPPTECEHCGLQFCGRTDRCRLSAGSADGQGGPDGSDGPDGQDGANGGSSGGGGIASNGGGARICRFCAPQPWIAAAKATLASTCSSKPAGWSAATCAALAR